MTMFRVPPGDPEVLRRLARRLGTEAGEVGANRTAAVRAAAGQVEPALPAARVRDFAVARKELTDTTQAVGVGLAGVAAAVTTWAEALEEAQHEVRAAETAHEDAEMTLRQARATGEPDLADQQVSAMNRQVTRAETAQSELRRAREIVCARLAEQAESWVPGGASLSGVQAWQAATAQLSPATVSFDTEELRRLYQQADPDLVTGGQSVKKLITAGSKGYQVSQVLMYLATPRLALRAETKYLKALADYRRFKGSAPDLSKAYRYSTYLLAERRVLDAYRKTSDLPIEVLRARKEFALLRGVQGDQRALEGLSKLHPSLSPVDIKGPPGKLDRVLGPARAVSPAAAKILGPVSVGLGAFEVYGAVTDDKAPADDRIARGVEGGATVIGGLATSAVAFGVVSVAAAPVVVGVAAAAGVVAAGAWAYQNREAIGHAAQKVGGAVAGGAKKVWKGLFG